MENILKSPCFVVHLDRCIERKKIFMKNLEEAGFKDINIFKGVNGSNQNEVNEAMNLFNIPNFDNELSKGQIGCTLSHFKVFKHIIDNNISVCCVFEDDISFHPNWKKLSQNYYHFTPKDFDMVYMGNQITPQRGKINTQSTFCTHAYIITLKGAIKLLNFLLNWNYKNFDHYNRGKTLNGLYVVDIMNITLQRKINNRQIPRIFTWYCWDGTYHPCDRNRLPLKGNDIRNSGLVFQNTDTLKTTIH